VESPEPYRLPIANGCFGANPLRRPLPNDLEFGQSVPVLIDLSEVTFVRPSGLGFIFVLAFTLMRLGRDVRICEPDAPDQRDYLRRTNFWGVMEAQGFQIAPELRGYNLGGAQGLIEPSIVRTDASETYPSHADAVFAAMQELITGRRDAAGNPAEGGYGLSIVAEEADYLAIRTGDALLESQGVRDDRGELVLSARQVVALDGTLVVATVSTQK
jgi:hypothetical protein